MNLIQWLLADDAIDEGHTADAHLAAEKARIRGLCEDAHLIQNVAFTDFLVAETKGRVAAVQDAIRGLDAKASTQLAFLATIMGALAIFGPKDNTHGALTPWLYVALGFTVCAFAFNIAVLVPYTIDAPSLEEYTDTASLTSPERSACFKAEYAARTLIYARRLARPNTRKGRWLAVGTAGLMFALASLLLNLMTEEAAHSPSYRTACAISKSALRCVTVMANGRSQRPNQ